MAENQVVKPRDAACLILYRRRSSHLEILLGRRPGSSSFMPDVYVFPGGGVERTDAGITLDGTLDSRIVSRIAVGNSERRAIQLIVAAIRETFEETGLMIAAPGSEPGTQSGPSSPPIHNTLPAFAEHGLVPDASLLSYVGRAITPQSKPKRFHARFFACNTSSLTDFDQQTLKGNGELLDLRWIKTSEVADFPMRSVTVFMIEELIRLLQQAQPNSIGSAVYTHRAGKLLVRHDYGKSGSNN